MADILTQIQDGLDTLIGQMSYILHYTNTTAPPSPIPNQPTLTSFAELLSQQTTQTTEPTQEQTSQPPLPTKPEFLKEQHSLSKDLVIKTRQLELLIAHLPGIGTSSQEQVERMQELEGQLEGIEKERVEAVKEREVLVEQMEEVFLRVGSLK